MAADDYLGQWRKDERLLANIGAVLFGQETAVEVRLPRELADAAVEAWQRDEEDVGLDLSDESCEDHIVRHRAGTLGLIGAAVEDRGHLEGHVVVVKLDAWFIGDALNAADDRGLIRP